MGVIKVFYARQYHGPKSAAEFASEAVGRSATVASDMDLKSAAEFASETVGRSATVESDSVADRRTKISHRNSG
ncbi:hypothetical protein BaRGS_00009015 [Batillaria attramentaria]|uniref:Uncharacterized protein n=1 Tax=Batillaria attramentaria TaxID=370345 RepID=A0ABD0LL38_9CAEN